MREQSVLIGHSFGALAAIKMVEETRKKIQGMLLVDPSVRDAFTVPWEEYDERRLALLDCWDWQMDLEEVREKVGKIIILSDTASDKYLKNWQLIHRENYAARLGAELRVVDAQERHFKAEKEPAVWQAADDLSFIL